MVDLPGSGARSLERFVAERGLMMSERVKLLRRICATLPGKGRSQTRAWSCCKVPLSPTTSTPWGLALVAGDRAIAGCSRRTGRICAAVRAQSLPARARRDRPLRDGCRSAGPLWHRVRVRCRARALAGQAAGRSGRPALAIPHPEVAGSPTTLAVGSRRCRWRTRAIGVDRRNLANRRTSAALGLGADVEPRDGCRAFGRWPSVSRDGRCASRTISRGPAGSR